MRIYRFWGTIPKKTSKENIEDYRLKCCMNQKNKKNTHFQEVRNNFILNPMWGSKVGRLKKVKDRLKNFIR